MAQCEPLRAASKNLSEAENSTTMRSRLRGALASLLDWVGIALSVGCMKGQEIRITVRTEFFSLPGIPSSNEIGRRHEQDLQVAGSPGSRRSGKFRMVLGPIPQGHRLTGMRQSVGTQLVRRHPHRAHRTRVSRCSSIPFTRKLRTVPTSATTRA